MQSQPIACRPVAFHLFAEQLPNIESTDGLLRAAVAITMHSQREVSLSNIDRQLARFATRVRSRVQSDRVEAVMAHLHEVLFEEVGFEGDRQTYGRARNSYLSNVLASRRGIPITLSLIYKVVAERVGLSVVGINSPAHFLVRVEDGQGGVIVDPFQGGRVLTTEEAFDTMERAAGRQIARSPRYLQAATHVQWIARILSNLQNSLTVAKQHDELAAMNELQALLDEALF